MEVGGGSVCVCWAAVRVGGHVTCNADSGMDRYSRQHYNVALKCVERGVGERNKRMPKHLTEHAHSPHDTHMCVWQGGPPTDLQRGDGLVLVHQVWHDGIQRALPLAGGPGTGAGVRPELAQILVLRLLRVRQRHLAARRRVLAGEQHRVGHLLHGQVADGAQGPPAGGAAGELGSTVGTYLCGGRRGKQMSEKFLQVYFILYFCYTRPVQTSGAKLP